ncbi:two-component sensor histidine kinase [Pseudomonas koreensis]|nr:two-component sensor histidine kinase [Pseudomonas koreensis]
MSLLPPSKDWRSSSSRLLALYSFLFVAWSAILMGVLYWEVTDYLSTLSRQSLMQRQHLFARFHGEQLEEALATSMTFDVRTVDAYGLFDADKKPLMGSINSVPLDLPMDGQIHQLTNCTQSDNPDLPHGSCDAVAMQTDAGRLLVLVRDNGSLFAVNTIIWHALLWAISLTIIPGAAGWCLLRRRPLRRIHHIQSSVEAIAAGEMTRRLPVSNRRDELDMLAVIVNTMLDRIEKLMHEVKGACDSIAHDLRTPLTRLRAQLYRLQQQSMEGSTIAMQMAKVIGEADMLMARFRALLQISELEDRNRRADFVELHTQHLLHELHEFYLPMAEENLLTLNMKVGTELPPIIGDRALLFEALANLLSNALKFTPSGGTVSLVARFDGVNTVIEVQDDGPGISETDREKVFRRFYRCEATQEQAGFGLGLSIVAAIVDLHGFTIQIGTSPSGGANMKLECRHMGVLM